MVERGERGGKFLFLANATAYRRCRAPTASRSFRTKNRLSSPARDIDDAR